MNILTPAEAANVLRCDVTDPNMLDLLPLIDGYIKNATGRDWSVDAQIYPQAKAAARMLLVMWHEDPAMMAQHNAPLSFGLTAALIQLEAIAGSYLQFQGNRGAGAVTLPGANLGDTVQTLTGLIGITGDQHASFETIITVKDQIQQVSALDLSAKWYRVYLVSVGRL